MKKTVSTAMMLSVLASVAQAQSLAPAPRAMPRTPVSRESTMMQKEAIPPSRQIQGPAAIIDGEKLRIGDSDLRLFGVVPPQLSASYGPQARQELDALANGQTVACQIRDRDRDGRLLATCHNASSADMALELLKRGLAVTARGSIAGTELAQSYLTAEQAAQSARIGLWSTVAAAPVAVAMPKPEPVIEKPREEEKPAPVVKSDKADNLAAQAKITADLTAQQQARIDDNGWQPDSVGFFERYQILIAGLLMLGTGLSIAGVSWAQKNRERSDELKAIAAALRGELMAARSVCLGRAKNISGEEEDKAATWPRIRASLYQAYVGRLGLLGAELARQVASIYGQSGDYASLYSATGTAPEAPKKQALETLAKYIDAVLPKLAQIEKSGEIPAVSSYMPVSSLQYSEVKRAAPAIVAAAPVQEAPLATAIESETPEPVAAALPQTSPVTGPAAKPANLSPVALWENVRGFLQSHRNEVAATPAEPQEQESDYAAMIEADMMRYQYGSNVESLDISPKKKQG